VGDNHTLSYLLIHLCTSYTSLHQSVFAVYKKISEIHAENLKKLIINFCRVESSQDRALRLAARQRDKEIC
jgi:hypothetical protein